MRKFGCSAMLALVLTAGISALPKQQPFSSFSKIDNKVEPLKREQPLSFVSRQRSNRVSSY